jgi:hypothetical protein
MGNGISAEAEQIRSAIVELLQEAQGTLSVDTIAVKLDIEHNRAKYAVVVLETEHKIRRVDGVEGIFYEIKP